MPIVLHGQLHFFWQFGQPERNFRSGAHELCRLAKKRGRGAKGRGSVSTNQEQHWWVAAHLRANRVLKASTRLVPSWPDCLKRAAQVAEFVAPRLVQVDVPKDHRAICRAGEHPLAVRAPAHLVPLMPASRPCPWRCPRRVRVPRAPPASPPRRLLARLGQRIDNIVDVARGAQQQVLAVVAERDDVMTGTRGGIDTLDSAAESSRWITSNGFWSLAHVVQQHRRTLVDRHRKHPATDRRRRRDALARSCARRVLG